MILTLANGKPIRGDLIKSAVLRSDLAPVPVTLEAEIRADAEMQRLLAEGQLLTAGRDGDALRIIKAVEATDRTAQGQHPMGAVRIIALLEACHPVAFVRERALIKQNATLAQIYRAAGATLRAIDADFQVPRFCCLAGDTPSFHIARALQEEGGAVRWKSGQLQCFRLADLFRQKPAITLPANATEDVASGFLERHEVPFFFSLDAHGAAVFGNRTKARSARFIPHTNAQRLRNLSRCLVHRKKAKTGFSGQLAAGDRVDIAGESSLVIVTAAHVFQSGTDGSGSNQYTRLWLASVEE